MVSEIANGYTKFSLQYYVFAMNMGILNVLVWILCGSVIGVSIVDRSARGHVLMFMNIEWWN